MYYTIYKIVNKVNLKTYIGKHQTKNLNDGYMGSGKLLKRAIAKHGIESFKKEILFVFDNEAEMNDKERELVVVNESTYNLCEGGKGGFSYINSQPKTETQLAASRKNFVKAKEKARAYSAQNLIKAKQKSQENNPNGTFFGRKHTEETKRKMRESALKRLGII